MYGIIDDTYLTDMASAIRAKGGASSSLTLSEMASAIGAIPAEGVEAMDIVRRTVTSYSGDVSMTGPYAFAYCGSLTTVALPSCVSVGSGTFYSCRSLASVSLPACETVGESAFYSCVGMSEVSLPLCSVVGSNAFALCRSLASVCLPSCSSILDNAFRGCVRLVTLDLRSASSVPTLGSSVFASTPIGGYSDTAGVFGSVYVPSSLLSGFQTADNWSSISSRIVGV